MQQIAKSKLAVDETGRNVFAVNSSYEGAFASRKPGCHRQPIELNVVSDDMQAFQVAAEPEVNLHVSCVR